MIKSKLSAALIVLTLLAGTRGAQSAQNIFGYIPTPPEKLRSYSKLRRFRGFLPDKIDLSSRFPEPRDQGELNSCVGWAVGYAARSYYAVTAEGRPRNSESYIPSPYYIYHSIREPNNCQSGAHFWDAFELLSKGSISLEDSPYSASCKDPKAFDREQATEFRIESFQRIDPKKIDNIKGSLAKGHPVIFGMLVGDAFVEHKGAKTYFQTQKRFDGRHAMTAVGYDESRQAIKVINSWGTNWAKGGFGWISYDTFVQNVLEAYTIRVPRQVSVPMPRPIIVESEETKINEEVVVSPVVPSDDELKPEKNVKIEPSPPIDKKEIVIAPVLDKPLLNPVTDDNCSRLKRKRLGDRLLISGFVGTEQARKKILRYFPETTHDVQIDVRPWPQCEVLLTLDNRLDDPDRPKLSKEGANFLSKGDTLVFEVVSPKKPVFTYISYIQADGSVVHLHQPSYPIPAPAKSSTRFIFGDGQDGRARFTISEPFGTEMIIVLASASPLFDKPLPSGQIERDYLSMLRKALTYKADSTLPDRQVSATYLGIKTEEKQQ